MSKIYINRKYCKKCRICLSFCPKSVFDINADRPEIINEEACIACRLCEYRCPDFAIKIEKEA